MNSGRIFRFRLVVVPNFWERVRENKKLIAKKRGLWYNCIKQSAASPEPADRCRFQLSLPLQQRDPPNESQYQGAEFPGLLPVLP